MSNPLSSATRARSLPKAAAWRRAQKSNLIPEGTDRVATGGAPTRSLLSICGRWTNRTSSREAPRVFEARCRPFSSTFQVAVGDGIEPPTLARLPRHSKPLVHLARHPLSAEGGGLDPQGRSRALLTASDGRRAPRGSPSNVELFVVEPLVVERVAPRTGRMRMRSGLNDEFALALAAAHLAAPVREAVGHCQG